MNNTIPKTLKITTRIRYPRQICFTPKFLKQLENEYASRQSLSQEEEARPVSKYKEKFIKAISFYLSQL